VNTSKILSKAIMSAVGDQIKNFHRLNGILAKLDSKYIRDFFIFGLAIIVVMIFVFIYSIFNQHFGFISRQQDLPLVLIFGLIIKLICCVFFFISTVIIYIFYFKFKELQSNIKVNREDVSDYC
jgi:hypothetical protein